jgi:prepilin-type N-terminal cleavage/methylation domain-containing protein
MDKSKRVQKEGTMQYKNECSKSQAGFTIIELMIALLVLTLMIAAFVGANGSAQRTAEEMHQRTVAIQDANRVIEQMRDTSKTGTFPANVTAIYPQNGNVAGIINLLDEVITVTYANAAANPLVATVTVTWTTYTGRQYTETVETYITQR